MSREVLRRVMNKVGQERTDIFNSYPTDCFSSPGEKKKKRIIYVNFFVFNTVLEALLRVQL